jgi:hypothetical protein
MGLTSTLRFAAMATTRRTPPAGAARHHERKCRTLAVNLRGWLSTCTLGEVAEDDLTAAVFVMTPGTRSDGQARRR